MKHQRVLPVEIRKSFWGFAFLTVCLVIAVVKMIRYVLNLAQTFIWVVFVAHRAGRIEAQKYFTIHCSLWSQFLLKAFWHDYFPPRIITCIIQIFKNAGLIEASIHRNNYICLYRAIQNNLGASRDMVVNCISSCIVRFLKLISLAVDAMEEKKMWWI